VYKPDIYRKTNILTLPEQVFSPVARVVLEYCYFVYDLVDVLPFLKTILTII
jgi:hypothetical protein